MKDAVRRTRLSRAEQHEMTRQRLREAAEIVIVRVGYAGASIDLIAGEAGFSRGAVYSNFTNKEAIFSEVLRVHMERENVELAAIVGSHPEHRWQQLKTWLGHAFLCGDRPLLRTELQLHAIRNPQFATQFLALHRKQMQALGQLVRPIITSSSTSAEAEHDLLAEALIAVALGLRLQRATASQRTGIEVTSTVERLCKTLIPSLRDSR